MLRAVALLIDARGRGLTLALREIGEVLGVTESRVSQLHTKAVLRLKSRLQAEATEAGI